MTESYLGLGSNLRSPTRQLRLAIKQLQKLPRTTIKKRSPIYLSQPMGVRSQPVFYNMVVGINTNLPPFQLLKHCQFIEKKQHRVKKKRWGARTIDIDVLLYSDTVINKKNLIIPHPEMHKRDFVLVPLLHISPDLCLPSGKRLDAYLPFQEIKYLK